MGCENSGAFGSGGNRTQFTGVSVGTLLFDHTYGMRTISLVVSIYSDLAAVHTMVCAIAVKNEQHSVGVRNVPRHEHGQLCGSIGAGTE